MLEVYKEFGRLDASVAWVVWNANFGFMGALLDEAGIGQIWPRKQPGPVFANSGAPGVAVPAEGGYRLSGNWKIVSGIDVADWIGQVAEPQEVESFMKRHARQRPLYRGFLPALVLPGCTAIVVGVAAAAIDDTVRLALTKKTLAGETMAEIPRVQSIIAASQADLDTARLLLLFAARGCSPDLLPRMPSPARRCRR